VFLVITQILRSHKGRFSEYERKLIEKGLLSGLPPGIPAEDYRSYEPVKVRGKPISESLIEERR